MHKWQRERANQAAIAQLGERQTEDLKVPGSIPGLGIYLRFLLQQALFSPKAKPMIGFEIRIRYSLAG